MLKILDGALTVVVNVVGFVVIYGASFVFFTALRTMFA